MNLFIIMIGGIGIIIFLISIITFCINNNKGLEEPLFVGKLEDSDVPIKEAVTHLKLINSIENNWN